MAQCLQHGPQVAIVHYLLDPINITPVAGNARSCRQFMQQFRFRFVCHALPFSPRPSARGANLASSMLRCTNKLVCTAPL